jgi:hypothetical protein
MRKLYSVLTLWCVLLLAPGVYEAFGNVTLNGTLAAVWIVGYLAQFFIFMWIMNLVGDQKILWWFIASLLPWAVDWSVPTSRWFLLLCAAVAVATAFWMGQSTQRAQSLQQRGIRATGTVLEVLKPWMNVVVNNVYIRRRLRLRIQRQDGAQPYEGIFKGLFMLGEIPSVGDRLALRVDPVNPQHFDYDKAASTETAQAASAAAVSDFAEGRSSDARLSDEYLSGERLSHEHLSGGHSHEHLSDELARLADLHKRGSLTDSEFAAAKKKLLR